MPTCPSCDELYGNGQRFCPNDGAALQVTDSVETATDTDNLIGLVIEKKYRLDEKIGVGGMGSVYRGRHLLMDRKVAIKVVRPEVAADEASIKRFHREAKHSCRLDHPNCVRVSDFGAAEDGLLYLVMEYLDGKTVGEEVYYDGPVAPRRVAHIAVQVAQALQHSHSLGIIHRDLKPDNIMLMNRDGDTDAVKVLDFGLAKLLERDDQSPALTNPSFGSLTEAGIVFGTPEYMSPEQASGNDLDPRTDIYSLGVVLYHMVTGQLPFSGDTFMAILTRHVTEPAIPPSTRRPDLAIPLELDRAIMRCLEKEPHDRPESAQELLKMFEAVLEKMPSKDARVPETVASAATIDLTAQVLHSGLATLRQPPVVITTPISRELTDPVPKTRAPGTARWVAVAFVLAAIAAAAYWWGLGGDGDRSEPTSIAETKTPPIDADPVAAPDAPDAPAAPATTPRDAAEPRGRDAGVRRVTSKPRTATPSPAVAAHLELAESARGKRRWLKVIAEADAALKIDSGHKRAAFLMGEALLESGDKPNACKYLRKAGRRWGARALYKTAGCGD